MILSLLVAALLLPGHAKPLLLIVQDKVPDLAEKTAGLDVMRPMAEALDAAGKVVPVFWSKEDALVAAAVNSGEFRGWSDKPTLKDAAALARVLRAEYMVFCSVKRQGTDLAAKADLYKGRVPKPIWTSEYTVSIVKGGNVDIDSASISIASTFAAQLDSVPFRDLPGAPKIDTPPPADGSVKPAPRLEVDKSPYANGMKALIEGRVGDAVAFLRDAVDVAPIDPEARLALIEALRLSGHPFLAADEAARAYLLMPDKTEFLSAEAQCWFEGGQPAKAYDLVETALTRNANDPAALSLMGDLVLGKLDFARAVDYYSRSLGVKPSAETTYKRAQAYAMLEQFDASLQDLDKAAALGLSQKPEDLVRRYRGTVRMLEPVVDGLAAAVRNLLKEAKANPSDKDIVKRAEALASRSAAFSKYFDRLSVPDSHRRSHEQRGLASNLLSQSAVGVQRYVVDHLPESYGDADLLQIEAMREFAAAKSTFEQEIGASRS
jgi:tetratricopeptide (TPR) repeat protein